MAAVGTIAAVEARCTAGSAVKAAIMGPRQR